MFAGRVYDQDFFAAMASRRFYVFTSRPSHTTEQAKLASRRQTLAEKGPAAAESRSTAAPLAEAA